MNGLTPISFLKGRASEPRLSPRYVPGVRHERFWTEPERDVLRKYYPIGGAAACEPHLPNRGRLSIYQMAGKLGLSAPEQPAERVRHDYGSEMDARIREAWPRLKGRGAVNRLAVQLDVPRWWLSKRALTLGLSAPHRKEPMWTGAEDALMRKVPLHDPERAARIFREHGFSRTATAIVVRAKRLEISRRTHETLSARGAARILGIDDKTATALCISGDLKAGRRGSKRLTQQGGDAWAIEPSDLRRYVLDHIERIDIRKVEKVAFVALLAGSDAIDPAVRPAPSDVAAGLSEVNQALRDQVAALEAENARLTSLAGRPAQAQARSRPSWRERVTGGRRRSA
ncbi:hypothetical protein [Methylobacterium brachiatum]|uniref:hypothetical protein n=1 Tax=Methylobacterium brachiatum TaxID=269660 RepID=UPI00244C1AB4|nr:hypothetical protein [Methylobacterium brachiatum]MDH2313084.1 hypothetical protein [Methylobacterium brachiatum]